MMNKKSSSSSNVHSGEGISRHQELLDKFRSSRLTPKEFITNCLQNGMVSGADALELMGVLKSKVTTRSFALADLSDETHFRQGLYETTMEDTENNPVFVIQFDYNLSEYSHEIQEMLEVFSRSLAEMISQKQDVDDHQDIDISASREEAMDTILDSLPGDAVPH